MKPLNRLIAVLALIFLTIPSAALAQDEAVSLQPKWTVGQTTRYHVWTKTEKLETAEINGQTQSGTTVYENDGEMTWTVDEVAEDGSAVCTMTLNKMVVTITPSQGEQIRVDSTKPSGDVPEFDQLLAAMTQNSLKVYVKPDGSIEKVEGVDAMKTAAGDEVGDAVPKEIDFIETASELATLIASPVAAHVGDTWAAKNTWSQEDVLPGAETMVDVDSAFTLDQVGVIEGIRVASVSVKSTLDIKIDLSTLPEDAPDVDIQIGDASGAGEILFDLTRHETIARNDTQKYTVNITIPLQPGIDVKITVAQSSQSQVLRISEESAE